MKDEKEKLQSECSRLLKQKDGFEAECFSLRNEKMGKICIFLHSLMYGVAQKLLVVTIKYSMDDL